MPTAAVSQTVAAVVRPRTVSLRTKMRPPPEADPRDNLRRNTRGIEHDPAGLENIGEAVFGDQHYERRRKANQGIGAQTGALLTNFALKTNGSAKNERECELSELEPALSHRLAE